MNDYEQLMPREYSSNKFVSFFQKSFEKKIFVYFMYNRFTFNCRKKNKNNYKIFHRLIQKKKNLQMTIYDLIVLLFLLRIDFI